MSCSRAFLVFLFWMVAGLNVAGADVVGDYDLVGRFQVSASVKGKSAKIVNKSLGRVSAVFTQDKQWLIDTEAFDFMGVWTAKKRSFKSQLSAASVSGLLRGIENDLLAKTGKMVLIEDPELMTLTGGVQKDGSLKGRLSIKARMWLLDYDNAYGKLAITYDFIGSRLQSTGGP